MTIVFQKSILKSKHAKRIVADAKLTYFKEKVLEHLDRLERKEKKKEQAVQKALIEAECLRKAAYPVGTIREWKGKKYIKTAPNKWRRKYDSDSRGAKQSLAAIKRKVDKCGSVEELLEVAKQNKHRFTDDNGKYLPFVKEMFDYVGKKHKEIKGANAGGNASSGAGKKKTLDAAQIMQAGKNGERVRYEDIDWDSVERDGKGAIRKKNIFGNVDWDALKAGGMKGGTGFLISRIYDCIEDEPMRDSTDARQGYVRGINELRDMLEGAKTAQDVQNALEKIKKEIRGDTSDINIKGTSEYKERKAKVDALEKEWKEAYQKVQELEARREYEKAEKARKKESRLRNAANAAEHELDNWEREQKGAAKKQRRDKWWYLGVDFHSLFDDNARLRKEISKQLSQAAKGKWNSWSWLKASKAASKNSAGNGEEELVDAPF